MKNQGNKEGTHFTLQNIALTDIHPPQQMGRSMFKIPKLFGFLTSIITEDIHVSWRLDTIYDCRTFSNSQLVKNLLISNICWNRTVSCGGKGRNTNNI